MERKETRQPNQIVKDNAKIEATPLLKQNYNYLLNLEDEFYREDGKYELEHPLCIITCHNRKPSVLDNLDQFTSLVYVFIYDFETHLYDWLEEKPNLKKVIVPDEFISVQKMRYFVQDYMKDQIYWVMDDDAMQFEFAIDKHKVKLGLGIKIIEKVIEIEQGEEFIITGLGCSQPASKFWNGKLLHNGSPFCLILFNGKKAIENNVHYTGDTGCNEDVEINIMATKAGYMTHTIHFLYLKPFFQIALSGSIASTPDKSLRYQAGNYIKFGEYLRFRRPSKQYPVGFRFCPTDVAKPREKDQKFLELCLNKDYQGMVKYWHNLYNKDN